jgi:flagellar hook-basal body complex protein FliE
VIVVAPISGLPGASASTAVGRIIKPAEQQAPAGFQSKMQDALESVASAERDADLKVQDVASGGDTPIHELMVATTKAALSVDLLVQTRNRAVEAYQEIMRMQV